MHPIIKLGTRASPMAIAVANHARDIITRIHADINVEIHSFVSEGDLIKGDLKIAGGKGTFIKDLECRLLRGEIDCAIHALKDIPGDVPMHEDLMLYAFLEREDPCDALVLRHGISEENLHKCTIGTSSPRRAAVLDRLYPGVETKIFRGNVNTRLAKLDRGDCDALVLSAAGLHRIGFGERISKIYKFSEMLPAVGQGILCLQIRKSDADRCTFLRTINDSWSEMAATVERAILDRLQGNCHSAIAAHCWRTNDIVTLEANVYDRNHKKMIFSRQSTSLPLLNGYDFGTKLADDLIRQGAKQII